MKILITGSSGFVGQYLIEELTGEGVEVFSLNRTKKNFAHREFIGDICDADFVKSVFSEVVPDEVYHLAGFSSLAKSFENPEMAMAINVGGTRNLLEAVNKFSPNAKVLIVSSGAVYEKTDLLPISEISGVDERSSPYAKSRINQEKAVFDYPDLRLIISRSFNHTGPGQQEDFVLPSFVKQAVEIEKGIFPPKISVGNLDVIRDFLDVRDVVSAYRILLREGKFWEVYNVASGIGQNLGDLLRKILCKVKRDISVEIDQSKIRPVDVPIIYADISKITAHTSWRPVYKIDKTIDDLLEYYREII